MENKNSYHSSFVQIAVALAGINYLLAGAGLLFAPEWFFENVGPFPPFNRHYSGDVGSFLLPLGIGLLIVARKPEQHQWLIAVATAASVLHALNHLWDDFVLGGAPSTGAIADSLPILVLAVLMTVAYWRLIQGKA